ncbi:MAG: hypothetical protein E7554_06295 [Ruminococcaceae bacterium]|nr:hypothetical protein [Oscillospiraceae bacterium]
MDNGYDYYGAPISYDYDRPLYDVEPQEQQMPVSEPMELPPEPEDSPYSDPVVRHILTLKDDKFRRNMLSYLNYNVTQRKAIHPAWVMLAIVLCFPVGLCLMYFGTRWGVFAKIIVTIFALGMALLVYELLVAGGIIPTPSLIGTVGYIFSQLFEGSEAPTA